jgi:hypothetical protein
VDRFADDEPVVARVLSISTFELSSITSSVSLRLIRQQPAVHLHHGRLDLFLRNQFLKTLARLHRRGEQAAIAADRRSPR